MAETEFDVYAFADYSGAASEREQRKRIAWCVGRRCDDDGLPDVSGDEAGCGTGGKMDTVGLTRAELVEAAVRLLGDATASGERVLFGFDHNYSMPTGLYEAAVGEPLTSWRQQLDWIADGLKQKGEAASAGKDARFRTTVVDAELHPREWASRVNAVVAGRLGTGMGPFWGPHFSPSRREFPFAQLASRLPERRVAETRRTGMKPVYQLGGAGSVGLQSLFGMARLRQLLRRCEEAGIPVHCWPFDGWTPPPHKHVMVEVYPTIYLPAAAPKRTDAGDAAACVRWAREQDRLGRLGSWLAEPPGLTTDERRRTAFEGWVLGVR